MALLQPKVPFWVSPVPSETPMFVVFGDSVWSPKTAPLSKTDSVNKKARFYFPNTSSVCIFFKDIAEGKLLPP